ncbi:hypothetical protein [Streptomyces bacillaris]|uniref:hypothetical protein n=1 Tax=Streptomyces bacillaris TaxID=68179 RepID=UPI00364500A5
MSGIHDDGAQRGRPAVVLTGEEADFLRWMWKITFRYDAAYPLQIYADQPESRRSSIAAFKILTGHASRGVDTRELAEALSLSPDTIRGCLDIASTHQASVTATQDRLGITELIAPLRTSSGAHAFLLAARDTGCTAAWWETVGVAIDAAIDLSDQDDDYDDLANDAWMAVEEPIRAAAATIANGIDIDELDTWYGACRAGSLSQMPAIGTLETHEDIRDACVAVALDIAQEFIGNAAGAASVRHLLDAEAYAVIAAPLIRVQEEQGHGQ